MRNLSPWALVASVAFAAAAASAGAAYEPQPRTSEGTATPKMQGSDDAAPSDSAAPATGDTLRADPTTPDEHHDSGDLNSGASPSPQDVGPRAVPPDALRHEWPTDKGSNAQSPGATQTPGSDAEDQGTIDSQGAKPDNPGSPFSPANPAAPALQDPQGGDPTNPVTPTAMRYMILA